MASNTFGTLFKITTWGESHGRAIGVVIDGCPAGLSVTTDEINSALQQRAPGHLPFTSARKEPDAAEILSGVFEGKTTGTPICILIPNRDANTSHYEPIKELLRPGHANYTYLAKYGVFDYRGGGRASARETACRVAAGAIAKKLLEHYDITLVAFIKQIGPIEQKSSDSLFSPDAQTVALLEKTVQEGDSLGGIVEFVVQNMPVGLGDPVYEKLEANLAKALMGLPATRGFEIGSGFDCVNKQGSEHNDLFIEEGGKIRTRTNHAGGTLGGISTGMPLIGRVVFKPTSSIRKPQETLNTSAEPATLTLPFGSRHDPCVAIRAAPVVEAMVALVIADALLLNRCSQLSQSS